MKSIVEMYKSDVACLGNNDKVNKSEGKSIDITDKCSYNRIITRVRKRNETHITQSIGRYYYET